MGVGDGVVSQHLILRSTKKCTRVADRAFTEVKVPRRQPGDFGRSERQLFHYNDRRFTNRNDFYEEINQ